MPGGAMKIIAFTYILKLTEVAGEGGPDLAPQKFLLSQQFRYLMRCKKYVKKIFLSCLVSEIQLFVYIFEVPNVAHPLLQPQLNYITISIFFKVKIVYLF